jgi:hypothetical protein
MWILWNNGKKCQRKKKKREFRNPKKFWFKKVELTMWQIAYVIYLKLSKILKKGSLMVKNLEKMKYINKSFYYTLYK